MTGDEMQRAIEFLLKNQANFEVQLEKTNQQLVQTSAQIAQTNQQLEQTNQQLEQTNLFVASLAETQTQFIQTVTRHVEAQGRINASMRRTMRELVKAQRQTRQDVSDLAKTVYKNGNPPQG